MEITLFISPETIANMFVSAIESGDPVTTARKGGWCEGIYLEPTGKNIITHGDPWYGEAETFKNPELKIKITEVDDESTGHITRHIIGLSDIARGLHVMAKDYHAYFGMVLSGDTDAPCADIFLQCILFGEEKYA